MNDAVHTFRVSPLRLTFAVAISHGLFAALVAGVVLLAGQRIIWLYLALFAVLPAIYWTVYGLKYRLVVSPEGLQWTNLEGDTLFARWDEIEAAHRDWVPFLGALGIDLTGGRGRSFLLLALSHPEQFGDALREYAGEEHPLTRALIGKLE